ncbi:MAG TPA: hypothetical protein VHZ27_13645 [Solirubrobacteraceae bacterium]|jgi:DNA-binding NarL/FixJ family response regulator|nr:hypothetical protein [Solirubrobacteraceae bacterium]
MSKPVRVLIAEDDVLMREGIARLLLEAGLEVVGRESGRGRRAGHGLRVESPDGGGTLIAASIPTD